MDKNNNPYKSEKSYPRFYIPVEIILLGILFSFLVLGAALFLINTDNNKTGIVLPIIFISVAQIMIIIVLVFMVSRANTAMQKVFIKIGSIAAQNDLNLSNSKKLRFRYSDSILAILDDLSVRAQQNYSYQLLQKQAQLDALQNQINPHFLYNALDSIRGLAIEQGAEDTADMTEALATLFRFSISKTNDFILLSQELTNMENYIKIQKYRFNNRFDLLREIEIPDEQLNEYRIPKLTLQPIIENALNHGLANRNSGGLITLRIVSTQSRLLISIADNGSGMDDTLLRSLNQQFQEPQSGSILSNKPGRSDGIALLNVNTRLKLIFGSRFGLTAYSTKSLGTEIQIAIPLIKQGENIDS